MLSMFRGKNPKQFFFACLMMKYIVVSSPKLTVKFRGRFRKKIPKKNCAQAKNTKGQHK